MFELKILKWKNKNKEDFSLKDFKMNDNYDNKKFDRLFLADSA